MTEPRPPMTHLPGFWDDENWAEDKWREYLRRRSGWWNQLKNAVEQALHRLMGRWLPEWEWKARELDQWPSGTGSFDPCEDHWNYLRGGGFVSEAKGLRDEARRRRPEFLA